MKDATSSSNLGTDSIGKLLISQSVPASIGFLVMSLNIVVDTIFVGNWIGAMAIAAISVVLPIVFLISSVGMAIGIGGASIISRGLGAGNSEKAALTFGNQISLVVGLSVFFVLIGLLLENPVIRLFGANGAFFNFSKTYFHIVLFGIPFLAFNMMGNNVIRAEGKPKFAMMAMIIPSITNILLDYLFINVMDYGMAGAAWATVFSYFMCFCFIAWFFISGKSELNITLKHLLLKAEIVRGIASIGGVSLVRQSFVSIFFIILNHTLFNYGEEVAVAIYGIIGRVVMFILFPVIGIMQGFMPIAGYNYGARHKERVREVINTSIKYASLIATLIFVGILFFSEEMVAVFTNDKDILEQTPSAMRIVFAATPITAIQLIGTAYFQAIGKAVPALILTLTKECFFVMPLILILPYYWGILGIWLAFPIANVLSTAVIIYFLNKEVKTTLIH